MSNQVPQEWTRVIGNQRAAQVANDVIRNPDATMGDKAEALRQFCDAADAIIGDLGLLSEQGVLARITLFLSRRERA